MNNQNNMVGHPNNHQTGHHPQNNMMGHPNHQTGNHPQMGNHSGNGSGQGQGHPGQPRPIVTSQPPDLIVHSTNAGNWQEHSFDSSIVTEGKDLFRKSIRADYLVHVSTFSVQKVPKSSFDKHLANSKLLIHHFFYLHLDLDTVIFFFWFSLLQDAST